MKRAAILVGVEKAGRLPRLKAARSGAEAMGEWARVNKFDFVEVITDEAGPVNAKVMRTVIKDIVEQSTFDQLIIYFAGHGVNIRFGEYWLLSGAPEDSDEAVNVDGAVTLARRAGIPHVVFLSDACRTAAEGIQAQGIDGSTIFPNMAPSGLEKSVDIFFACSLGAPSHEIRDAGASARRYCAVYTDTLIAALHGEYPEFLMDDSDGSRVLRPRPLKKLLEKKVPLRIEELLGDVVPISQTPDARITSDDDAWLACFASDNGVSKGVPMGLLSAEPSLSELTHRTLRNVLTTKKSVGAALRDLANSDVLGAKEIAASVADASAFTAHFETSCGFQVRGAVFRTATAAGADVQILKPWLVQVTPRQSGTNVLLELQDGRGVILPALKGFIATLAFEAGELRNVAYEPSDRTDRWQQYIDRREELSALRALIASSAHVSGFHLDRDDAPQLTERIRLAKGLDPTMALYAAYSYHNLGERELIKGMQRYLQEDIGVTFFDIAMLSGHIMVHEPILPFTPMLSQGWALLGAFSVRLPGRLAELRRFVGPSLWTVFDEAGVQILRYFMRA
jgi:hypothetical protein